MTREINLWPTYPGVNEVPRIKRSRIPVYKSFKPGGEDLRRQIRAEEVRAIAGDGPERDTVRVMVGGVEYPAREACLDDGLITRTHCGNKRVVVLKICDEEVRVWFNYDDIEFVMGKKASEILRSEREASAHELVKT